MCVCVCVRESVCVCVCVCAKESVCDFSNNFLCVSRESVHVLGFLASG